VLKRALVRSFWSAYDSLGVLVLGNLLWIVLTAPLLALLFFAGSPLYRAWPYVFYLCAIPVVFLGPPSAGLAAMARRLVDTGETSLSVFWTAVKHRLVRSVFLMTGAVLTTMIFSASFLFYARGVVDSLGRLGNMTAAGLSLWSIVILAGMTCYWLPVADAMPGRQLRLWSVIRRGALLTLDNPGHTLGLLILTVVMVAFWCGTGLGVAVIGASAIHVFHAHALRVLQERYTMASDLKGRGRPATRRAVREALAEEWAAEPRRSLRELMRPWDS
jgi:hypothetical protein